MERLITTKEAAKKLNITPNRILALIYAKRLPAIKRGRDWVIRNRDLKKVEHRKVGRPKRVMSKPILRYGE